jgi:DnaJ-class molecular chaperone
MECSICHGKGKILKQKHIGTGTTCPDCQGSGKSGFMGMFTCGRCDGTGSVRGDKGAFESFLWGGHHDTETCPFCRGKGYM